MRLIGIFAFALCLAPLTGCGDDSASTSPDLSVVAGDNCLAIVMCAGNCNGNMTCATTCATKGTTKAQGAYQALFTCAYGVCTKPSDAGAAACTSATDGSSGCVTCVTAAGQSSACATQLSACLAN